MLSVLLVNLIPVEFSAWAIVDTSQHLSAPSAILLPLALVFDPLLLMPFAQYTLWCPWYKDIVICC